MPGLVREWQKLWELVGGVWQEILDCWNMLFLFFVFETVSLCSSACPGTHHWPGWPQLRVPPTSASPVHTFKGHCRALVFTSLPFVFQWYGNGLPQQCAYSMTVLRFSRPKARAQATLAGNIRTACQHKPFILWNFLRYFVKEWKADLSKRSISIRWGWLW